MTDNSNNVGVRHITVAPEADGQRLDNYLLKSLKGVPKTRIYRMIRSGELRLEGKRARFDTRLYAGVRLRLPPLRLPTPEAVKELSVGSARDLGKRILYEDDDILIINKPANWATHGGTGIELGLIEALRQMRKSELNLVHRLDRQTSGCLLCARNIHSLRSLGADFANRAVDKTYRAIVHGRWPQNLSHIEQALSIERVNGERRAIVSAGGQAARSEFEVLEQYSYYSQLSIKPITGRMHQIRAHCAHAGHPVVGDSRYGEAHKDRTKHLLLHCQRLVFQHPTHGNQVDISASLPQHWADFLNSL